MRTPFARRLGRALGVMLLGTLCMAQNCLNPCQQLAQKICSCERTEEERQRCTAQANVQQNQRNASSEERLACQEWFTTCECRDLAEGRLEECGLSRE